VVVTAGFITTEDPVTAPTLGVRVMKLAPVTVQLRVVGWRLLTVEGDAQKLEMRGGLPTVTVTVAVRHPLALPASRV